MNEDRSSQVHNDESQAGSESRRDARQPDWDPTAFFQMGLDLWTRLATDQLGRVSSLCDEPIDSESDAHQRTRRVNRDLAVLTEKTLTYVADMATEWQAMTLAATRKSREFFVR